MPGAQALLGVLQELPQLRHLQLDNVWDLGAHLGPLLVALPAALTVLKLHKCGLDADSGCGLGRFTQLRCAGCGAPPTPQKAAEPLLSKIACLVRLVERPGSGLIAATMTTLPASAALRWQRWTRSSVMCDVRVQEMTLPDSDHKQYARTLVAG